MHDELGKPAVLCHQADSVARARPRKRAPEAVRSVEVWRAARDRAGGPARRRGADSRGLLPPAGGRRRRQGGGPRGQGRRRGGRRGRRAPRGQGPQPHGLPPALPREAVLPEGLAPPRPAPPADPHGDHLRLGRHALLHLLPVPRDEAPRLRRGRGGGAPRAPHGRRRQPAPAGARPAARADVHHHERRRGVGPEHGLRVHARSRPHPAARPRHLGAQRLRGEVPPRGGGRVEGPGLREGEKRVGPRARHEPRVHRRLAARGRRRAPRGPGVRERLREDDQAPRRPDAHGALRGPPAHRTGPVRSCGARRGLPPMGAIGMLAAE
mmetsp:Transcript_83955/g.238106  ORF Transcript_83955/g.238106 Transcript_83955/m.238106 type:complete len:324 (-) Transcript_83955:122-1093(-)